MPGRPSDCSAWPLSARCLLPPLLRLAQPLRHLLVLHSVRCPTLGGRAPAIIDDRHVDAAIDEELHRFVILVEIHQLMQDAGGLAGAWELQFVLMSAPRPRRKSAISKWLLRTAQASAVSRTCSTLG